jgi:HEAT repeat protein
MTMTPRPLAVVALAAALAVSAPLAAQEDKVQKLVAALSAGSDDDRIQAADEIATCGEGCTAALPWLVDALKDKNLMARTSAANALKTVLFAARAWNKPVTAPKGGLEALRQALKEASRWKEPNQRRLFTTSAVEALGFFGKEALPDIVPRLKEKDTAIRVAAVDALRHLGPDAQEALPQLQGMKTDGDEYVRQQVEQAIQAIGPS